MRVRPSRSVALRRNSFYYQLKKLVKPVSWRDVTRNFSNYIETINSAAEKELLYSIEKQLNPSPEVGVTTGAPVLENKSAAKITSISKSVEKKKTPVENEAPAKAQPPVTAKPINTSIFSGSPASLSDADLVQKYKTLTEGCESGKFPPYRVNSIRNYIHKKYKAARAS